MPSLTCLLALVSLGPLPIQAANDFIQRLFTVGPDCASHDLDSMLTETLDMAHNAIQSIDMILGAKSFPQDSEVAHYLHNAVEMFGVQQGFFSGITNPSIARLQAVKGD